MSFVENQDMNAKYRGYNPEFVKRVLEKRRKAAKEARKAALRNVVSKRAAASREFKMEVENAIDPTASLQRIKDELRRGSSRYRPTVSRIIERACIVFNVFPSEINGPSQVRRIVLARWFVCYWASRITPYSYPQIGRLLGKDHTTVLNGKLQYRKRRAEMGRHLKEAR